MRDLSRALTRPPTSPLLTPIAHAPTSPQPPDASAWLARRILKGAPTAIAFKIPVVSSEGQIRAAIVRPTVCGQRGIGLEAGGGGFDCPATLSRPTP
jgi:hypothetical protein